MTMGCNCGKPRLAPGTKFEVTYPGGSETFSTEAAAKIAAAKLGGVVKPKSS